MPGTATTILIDGTPTSGSDPWIDSLVGGGAWKDGNGGTVTIQWTAFQGTMDGGSSYGWTSLALAGLREALSLWETVANIDFVEVSGAATADVKFWWGTEAQAGGTDVLGWSDLPGFEDYYSDPASEARDVLFNAEDAAFAGALDKGSLGLVTMVHEIGHLLGLAHPHDGGAAWDASPFPGVNWMTPDSYGTGALNQGIFTTMSYNFGWPQIPWGHTAETWGLQYGPMALDIAAIQAIYGANTNYASGNTVYKLPTVNGIGTYFSAIWDTGGIDTISNEGASGNATVDLRAAGVGIDGGGKVSYGYDGAGTVIAGGYTIARGVVIENAIGGNGDDTLIGNAISNRLEGGLGQDSLDGGAGADTMIGGAGNDSYYVDDAGDVIVELNTGSEVDTVYSSAADYTLAANVENLILTGTGSIWGRGNDSANTITGNSGANILWGGAGDKLYGGTGDDRLAVTDLAFELVDGGLDTDTLFLSGAGFSLDLSDPLVAAKLKGIERIDLWGTGDNTLIVSQAAVLGGIGAVVGQKHILVVEGDSGDKVQFAELNWIKAGSFTNADGTFDRWVRGNAEVHVEQIASPPVIPPPSGTVLLSSLTGINGFKLSGVAANDYSGMSVASAGDVNGDGFDDVIVGATGAGAGSTETGASYVVFGKASGFSANINLSTLNGSNGFKLSGASIYDESGQSVASAGDVNGDGFADLLIGAPFAGPNGDISGATYVVFGKASGFAADINLSTLNGSNGFKLSGEAEYDFSGAAVASAGDFNGDGYDDLIIGAKGVGSLDYSGASYIIYGKASGFAANLELSSLTAGMGVKLNAAAAWERSGGSVASAGDVNRDGFDDVIVGAYFAGGSSYTGASYVVFGRASAVTNIDLSTLNGSNGFKLSGAAGDSSGISVASAGDVNGDGFADLIIGATGADSHGSDTGAAYVVFGKASGFAANFDLPTLNGSNGFKLSGAGTSYNSGWSVASAGDVNGDGFADLIVGATGADSSGTDSGTSYVVFGKASGFAANIDLTNLNDSTGFLLQGAAAGDISGWSVASAGDVNGDGYDDLIVGAFRADPNGADSGASYVVFGGALGGSGAPVTTTGTSAAEILIGGRGNDVLTGGGGGDVFHAGAGDDRLVVKNLTFRLVDGGAGTDTLALDGAGLSLDLSKRVIAAKLEGIERIDLSGTGNNTLIVNQLSVLGGVGAVADGKHILVVERNFGDTVQFAESAWTNTGSFANDDGIFARWVLGNAEVHVQQVPAPPGTGVTIVGTPFDDILTTTASVSGQPLATELGDIIDGGAGVDTMAGGQGDDTYVVDNIFDSVIEVAFGGTDLVRSSAGSYTLGENVENLDLIYGGRGTGNALDNRITGSAWNNVLDGNLGADTLVGGQGDDVYLVDNAGDIVIEEVSGGQDTVNSWISYALSANVEKLVLMGDDAINGTGNKLQNTLTGNDNANILDGGAGADVMTGWGGDDTYIVDDSAEFIEEYLDQGTDTVLASVTFWLGANVENLVLTGSAPLGGTGNELRNVLTGNAGNNMLDGGADADTMVGGVGNDTYTVDNAGDVVTELADGGIDTVLSSVNWTLGTQVERLTLIGVANLAGTGNELANLLTGSAGNNILDGKAGADSMAGGLGDDTYVVDVAGDVVTEGIGEGTDTINAWLSWTLGANLEQLRLMGAADLNGTGNSLNNALFGNAGKNILNGGAGADTMVGGLGDDTYVVDRSDDVVVELASQGTDTVQASISWTLGANVENLVLTGKAAIGGTGNGLRNALTGNAGNNMLDGGADADTMAGGAGNDTYMVDNAGDVVTELVDGGIDTVLSSVSWTLGANVENLVLTGKAAIGGTGNGLRNALTGNAGNNMLDGGADADTMAGGAGSDTYTVDNAGDVVTELADGGIDTVLSSVNWTLGAQVERLTLTGVASLRGTGNELKNILTGNAGNNILDGKAGADSMVGGLGDDTYIVDETGDVTTEAPGAGIDTVQSSITWRLRANIEKLVLAGEANIDGTGNELANVLTGNSGNNVLDGGAGADAMIGGLGDDTYWVNDKDDKVTETAGQGVDTVRATVDYVLRAHVENLTLAGNGRIKGNGNDENNVIVGNAGNNLLNGRAGADTLEGRAGNDTYIVDNAGDLIVEAAGGGVDEVQSSVSYTLAANIEKLRLIGIGNIDGTGNGLANFLVGNSGNNILDGEGGADTMGGGLGNDTYIVNDAGDRVNENPGGGIDTVLSSISHTLRANVENLILTGKASVSGTGNDEANVLSGNEASNVLDGRAGADTMVGGGGNDFYVVENAGDVVTELANGGTDTVRAWISYALTADVEQLALFGTADIDAKGNGIANDLTGNTGHNILDGGLGVDTLRGGGGGDTYRFSTALGSDNVDRIVTFYHEADTIQLDHSIFAALGGGALAAEAFNKGTVATQADDRILFDAASKSLYYDADGAGGVDAVQFAAFNTLRGGLDHTDFLIV